MKNYEGRNIDLKNKINHHLSKLTRIEADYYSKLNQRDLIELKNVLADINNVLTFKMTISATNWICDYFELSELERAEILKKVDETKPNTNGFDIHINNKYKIVAEVKCISPVNNGEKYGAAQRASILEDFQKLQNGKPSVSDTTEYYKFMFLINLGNRTDKALDNLLKQTNLRVETKVRKNRNEVKNKVLIFSDELKRKDLKLEKIYCKQIIVE